MKHRSSPNDRPVSFVRRAAEVLAAVLLALALAAMQTLIGGTRLVFSLPVYGLLAILGFLALVAARDKPSASRFCLWSSAIFFGYILVRAWFSPVPYLARADIFSILGGLLVYLFTSTILTEAKPRIYVLVFLALFATGQVVIGAIQFRNGDNFMLIPFLQRFDYGRRASGFYVCPNHFAGMLEMVGSFGLAVAVWSRWPVWKKVLLAYVAGLCYVGLALTGSRGGYISASCSLVVIAILTLLVVRQAGREIFLRTAMAGALLAAVLGIGLFFGCKNSDFLSGRAGNVFDTQNMRIDLWEAAIAEWKLQPIIGTGSGTYLYYGRHFRTPRVQVDAVEVHNDYLHLLCEYGLVGVAALLLFLGTHLWRGWKNFQKLGPLRAVVSGRLPSNNLALQIGALGAVTALLVHSAFDFNLHIPANVLLLAFVFGILANCGIERSSEGAPNRQRVIWSRAVLCLLALLLAAGFVRYLPSEYFAERARAALRDERHLAATVWAKKAVAHDTQNPYAWFYLGESWARSAESLASTAARKSFQEAALSPLQRALALAPNDETFLIALGRIYDSLGRSAEAQWMFSRALSWDPNSEVTQKSYAAHLALWRGAHPSPNEQPRLELPDKNAPLGAALPTPGRL